MVRLAAFLAVVLACSACGGAATTEPSGGDESVAVPHLVGLTTEAAVEAIGGNGLCVGAISWGDYGPRSAGRVLRQQPPPGRLVAPSTSVSITIAPMGPNGDIVRTSSASGCEPAGIYFPTPG